MNININFKDLCLLACGVGGALYGIVSNRKLEKVAEKLNRSVDDISAGMACEVAEDIRKAALDKAIDKAVSDRIAVIDQEVRKQAESSINAAVDKAVDDIYATLKDDVSAAAKDAVDKIGTSKVEAQATKEVVRRLNDDINKLLDNYGKELKRNAESYRNGYTRAANDGNAVFHFSI